MVRTTFRVLIVALLLLVLVTPSVMAAGRPIPSYAEHDDWRIWLRTEGGDGKSYSGSIPHFFRVRWIVMNEKPSVCSDTYLSGGIDHSGSGDKLVVSFTVDDISVPLDGPYTELGFGECGGVVVRMMMEYWYSPLFDANYFASGWHHFDITYFNPVGNEGVWPPQVIPGSYVTTITAWFCIFYDDPGVCG
jgi:hypothetical protein